MRRLGATVHYVSRTGSYEVPAIVTANAMTINQANVDLGLLPGLQNEGRVHLLVMSPGPSGRRAGATDFKVESQHGRSENQGGTYTEWDIPEDSHGAPGTIHDVLNCPFGPDGGLPRG